MKTLAILAALMLGALVLVLATLWAPDEREGFKPARWRKPPPPRT